MVHGCLENAAFVAAGRLVSAHPSAPKSICHGRIKSRPHLLLILRVHSPEGCKHGTRVGCHLLLSYPTTTRVWIRFKKYAWVEKKWPLTDCPNGGLTDCLMDWLTDWLTKWLADWLTDWLTDWLNQSINQSTNQSIKGWMYHQRLIRFQDKYWCGSGLM